MWCYSVIVRRHTSRHPGARRKGLALVFRPGAARTLVLCFGERFDRRFLRSHDSSFCLIGARPVRKNWGRRTARNSAIAYFAVLSSERGLLLLFRDWRWRRQLLFDDDHFGLRWRRNRNRNRWRLLRAAAKQASDRQLNAHRLPHAKQVSILHMTVAAATAASHVHRLLGWRPGPIRANKESNTHPSASPVRRAERRGVRERRGESVACSSSHN